jgi:hypothetical protein
MAPDAKDPPAGAAEGAVDETVAGLISVDLSFPELRIGLGLRGVDRTAVPSDRLPEVSSVLINNRAVWKHRHGNHVFFHGDRIVKITLPIHELLQARHHEICNLTLRFRLGRKNARAIFTFPHGKSRSLKDGVYINAKTPTWL